MADSGKKDKVERVIDGILSYMIDHHLRIGSKLPSEEEFTHQFQVSRLCIREALRGLKFLGFVETGNRRGTTVREVDFALLSRVLGFQIAVSDVSFQELLQARVGVELAAVDILCDRESDDGLEELAGLAQNPFDTGGDKAIRERDFKFHEKLLLLTGNALLISFAKMIELFFARPMAESSAAGQARVTGDHQLLVRALRERDKELARGILRSHLAKYNGASGNFMGMR